jgi:hypothetical protein
MSTKKSVLRAPKPKKPKFVGRAISVAQIKLGGEPSLGMFPGKMELVRAFNWYAQCVEPDQRAKFLVAYLETEGGYTKDQIAFADRRGKKFPETWAYVSRMLCNGTILDDDIKVRLNEEVAKFLARDKSVVELDDDGMPVEKPKRERPVNTGIAPMVNYIEDLIEQVQSDKDIDVNFYEALTRQSCSATQAKLLLDHFEHTITEFLALYSGRDDQLNEGYEFLKKNTKQRLAMFVVNLKRDLEALVKAKKERVRKPRKKKEVPAAKQVSRLRFQKDNTEYKVASIDPSRIVGAKALITFDTKRRIVTIFEANDEKGIQVRRTNIVNAKGRAKKVRKPAEFLASLMSMTRSSCGTQYNRLTTNEFESNCRTSTDTILLRVFQ